MCMVIIYTCLCVKPLSTSLVLPCTMVKTSDRIPCVQRGKGQLSHTFPKLFINTIISLIGFHPLSYPLNSLHVLNSSPCIPGLIDAYTTFPRITLPFSLPWVLMLLGKASHTKYINSELAYFCEYITYVGRRK